MVATKYRNSPYAADALDAIERCFKKNYQDLVAKVDGFPITRIEYDDRFAQSPGSYDTYEKKLQLLNDMINERLMYNEAIVKKVDTTSEYINRFTENRMNSMFQAYYQREVVNKVKISESDKKKYYNKHKSEFIIPEQVQAKEILVKTKPEADSLYKLITTYSLNFDSVASETSLAPTKSNGGDLGYFRRGTQPVEVENVIFKLKAKQVSKPFYSETKAGYMIVKVEDTKPKVVRNLKDASAEIENRLRAERIDQSFKDKTDGFKNNCVITIDENAIISNYDTVATIDGTAITQKHITTYLERIPPFYRSEFDNPEGKKRILDQIILETTWLKELEKEKYWLLNTVFSQIQDTRKNLLIGNIRKMEINDKVFVTDDEVEKDYRKNLSEYKVAKQIRARELTVKTEAEASQIRKLAVVDKIPFDSLVRQYSVAGNNAMGGDMGYFSVGQQPKEIENVAFKLNKDQISKIITRGDSTYTIIKVEDIKDAYTKKLDEVKPTISRKLRIAKEQEMNNMFTNNLRQNHQIEIYLVNENSEQIELPPNKQ
jgi:peptidyl-prolyl cis-trans isomerase C